MKGADIAFLKPVSASSIYDDDQKYKPEYLTNGKSCISELTFPAAATKHEDKPWFRVNLQGKFYIRTVVLTPRESKFTETILIYNQATNLNYVYTCAFGYESIKCSKVEDTCTY